MNGGIFDLLDVFGLRLVVGPTDSEKKGMLLSACFYTFSYGLDLQLKANDPRVSVWAANDGLVFDLLLFGMLLVMSRMLQSGYSEEVGTMLRTAMENSRWHSKVSPALLLPSMETRLWQCLGAILAQLFMLLREPHGFCRVCILFI